MSTENKITLKSVKTFIKMMIPKEVRGTLMIVISDGGLKYISYTRGLPDGMVRLVTIGDLQRAKGLDDFEEAVVCGRLDKYYNQGMIRGRKFVD